MYAAVLMFDPSCTVLSAQSSAGIIAYKGDRPTLVHIPDQRKCHCNSCGAPLGIESACSYCKTVAP